MQLIYIPILILSIVSAFFVFGKLKLLFFGDNLMDLGFGIIGAWFFIFFVCVTIWSAIFVYLGIPILIIGGIALVAYFIFSKSKGTESEADNSGDVDAETIVDQQPEDQQEN